MIRHKILTGIFIALAFAGNCHAQTPPASGIPSPSAPVRFSSEANAPDSPLSLWYRKPAIRWTDALPIGNGRFGGMIFGAPDREHMQLNEDTLSAGGPYDPANPNALAALPEARKLVFDGKYDEAHQLISQKMMAVPLREMPYQTMGDLFLDFPADTAVGNYRRDLDLDTAIASVSFAAAGVNYRREFFSSPVDQVIVIRLTADKPGHISFTAEMNTPQNATVTTEGGNTLVMTGVNGDHLGIKGVLKFQARAVVLATGGKMVAGAKDVAVTGADSATLLIAAATSYKTYQDVSGDPEAIASRQIAAARVKPFDALRAAHIAEHGRLFHRVALEVGRTDAMKLPTDQRIAQFDGGGDPQLAALYFQFARYLLISCSRPGCQPATLQGLWNDSMKPPWDSKYTININTEMNYWPAETTNLGECVEPLTAMVLDMTRTGARRPGPIRRRRLGGPS